MENLPEIVKAMLYNASLLIVLAVVHEFSYNIRTERRNLKIIISSIFISLIGIAVMLTTFKIEGGIVFDTRSILIGATALAFGFWPSVILVAVTGAFRLIMGGGGTLTGISVIVSSAVIGLLWRNSIKGKKPRYLYLNFYLFGIAIHLAMLACMLFLPKGSIVPVIKQIGLPVMTIYPVFTVILCSILFHQKEFYDNRERIAESEERYSAMFNNDHTVMMILEPEDGTIVDVNPAAEKFYGRSKDELVRMNISEINTLPRDEIMARMAEAVTKKTNYFLFKHRNASGQEADVEVYSSTLLTNGKKRIFSIIHDISRRVKALEELSASEKRFRYIVEEAPVGIFIQTDNKFAYVNKALLEVYGAGTQETLIGTPVFDRFHIDYHDVIKDRIRKLNIDKKAVPHLEEIHLKMDGSPVYVDVAAVPFTYLGQDGAMAFVQDITEKKELEAKNREIQGHLYQQQKLEAIGTLASGVAHEINNPLNGIMNYSQIIIDDDGKGDNVAAYAKEILGETERISGIVRSLLQFSRQDKQSHSYASVENIIMQTVSLINTIIKKDQITLGIEIEEGIPKIKCRSQQIQQVLMNLLTNARDALNEKYPGYDADKIMNIACSKFERDGRRWVGISVTDNGNGITNKMKNKIFEPFYSTKPKESGTGLGLSISHGIVKEHHGNILIESKPGKYTRFTVELPVDNGWDLSSQGGLAED
ncbi:MAG: PAS domain S-box protein [Clostridia bacterium]|nr:PAS domain S-box protein [Clostridia bacterium]